MTSYFPLFGRNAASLHYAPGHFVYDRGVLLAAITQRAEVLGGIPSVFRRDRGFILAAVTRNGQALEFAPQMFREDIQIVHAAQNAAAY